jgi:hypothetical protein
VFEQNAERIRAVVLDMVGRSPADLDTLGARDDWRIRAATGMPPAPTTSDLRDGCRGRPDDLDADHPTPAAAPAPRSRCTDGVRCGARIPISSRCASGATRLASRPPAASQAHGTAILGASRSPSSSSPVIARIAVAGIGPWTSSLVSVGADPLAAGDDLDHQRRLGTPARRPPHRRPELRGIGPETAFVQSPSSSLGRRRRSTRS